MTVIVKCAVSAPVEFVAIIPYDVALATVDGMPVICPVEVLSDRPMGRLPEYDATAPPVDETFKGVIKLPTWYD